MGDTNSLCGTSVHKKGKYSVIEGDNFKMGEYLRLKNDINMIWGLGR